MRASSAGPFRDKLVSVVKDPKSGEPPIESFLGGERRSLEDWRGLWESDRTFPIVSHRGLIGRPIVWLKKTLRALVRSPQADLWERQRAYNLWLQGYLEEIREEREAVRVHNQALDAKMAAASDAVASVERLVAQLGRDLQQVQSELVEDNRALSEAITKLDVGQGAIVDNLSEKLYGLRDDHLEVLEAHEERIERVEGLNNRGWAESMDHTTALFSRLDQKLDRYRDESRGRWSRLGALLEIAERRGPEGLARAVADEAYVEFEGLFRGREDDIGDRLVPYLPILEGRGKVIDLGCGRGEALEVLSRRGIPCAGVDSNSEMVDLCRDKGLEAETGDLFDFLARQPEGSLGAVVSFHVIEHLPADALEGLVRRAWLALKPGGVLILETPSPLSLVVAARNFWLDPTHLRPVHPESLKAIYGIAGFDPVERLDLQPFAAEERLPDIEGSDLAPELQPLVDRVNRLRDALDRLLFGFQDFGLVGYKPQSGGAAQSPAGATAAGDRR